MHLNTTTFFHVPDATPIIKGIVGKHSTVVEVSREYERHCHNPGDGCFNLRLSPFYKFLWSLALVFPGGETSVQVFLHTDSSYSKSSWFYDRLYYIVSIISPRIWLVTFSIPLLEAIRVEADKDVEVDRVQDPFYLGVALLLQEEGGKLQQHLALISSTST